jgi:hypothetical protein
LHEKLVLVIEEKDAERPMRQGIRGSQIIIGMGFPFIDGT